MSNQIKPGEKQMHYEEIQAKSTNGMAVLLLNIALMIASLIGIIFGCIFVDKITGYTPGVILIVVSSVYFLIVGPILFCGLKVLKPKEALVLTLFGKYYGTLKGEGFFFVNPFVTAINPAIPTATTAAFTASVSLVQDMKDPEIIFPAKGG